MSTHKNPNLLFLDEVIKQREFVDRAIRKGVLGLKNYVNVGTLHYAHYAHGCVWVNAWIWCYIHYLHPHLEYGVLDDLANESFVTIRAIEADLSAQKMILIEASMSAERYMRPFANLHVLLDGNATPRQMFDLALQADMDRIEQESQWIRDKTKGSK